MDGSVCIWDVLSERVTPCPCVTCRVPSFRELPHLTQGSCSERVSQHLTPSWRQVIKKLQFTSPPILCQYNRVKQGEVAIVNEDNTVRLWNTQLDNAMLIREMSYSTPTVLRWATQDAVRFAGGFEDSSVSIYNVQLNKFTRIRCSDEKFGAHEGGIFDCAWDPLSDNYLLVSFGSGRMAM